MDRKKSILNVVVSVVFQVVTMVMGILVKRLLIHYCGNSVNGLNALYLSIIGILSVAELGIGNAITFGMYRPIVEGNTRQVAALYCMFDRTYKLIGGAIFLVGLALIPFLPHLAVDYSQLNVSLPGTFFFMLVSAVLTYLFGAKTALINAYKNNYITTVIYSSGLILQYILQAVALILTQSFSCFLACKIAAVLLQWIVTNAVSKRQHREVLLIKADLEPWIRKELVKNIRAMFMHKIGGILVNTVDSVVISTFIGVAVLGEYSNYTAILLSMTSVILLIFTSLTSIMGQMYISTDKETAQKYCDAFHLVNFCVATVFYMGYYAVSDDLVAILFGPGLKLERSIVFVVALNGFVQFMRSSVLLFRDATGTFYNDRWKPLAEGLLNLILSVSLAKRIGILGVIIATILTNLLICHVVEPYVLYKNAFSKFPIKYYIRNYVLMLMYVLAQIAMECCLHSGESQWINLLINGCISLAVSLSICCTVFLVNKDACHRFVRIIRHKLKK